MGEVNNVRTPGSRVRPFLISGIVSFSIAFLVLLYLGPVWIYDVEDHIAAFILAPLLVLICLSILVGHEPLTLVADYASTVASAAAGATSLLLRTFGRFARGVGPSALGMVSGSLVSLCLAWALSKTEPLRLAYARARPERALAADYIEILHVVRDYQKLHGQPPENLSSLAEAIAKSGARIRFSKLLAGVLYDPWSRPFQYRAKRKPILGWQIVLYSVGGNGLDEGGEGDDVSVRNSLGLWKIPGRILKELLPALDDLKRSQH